MERTLRVNDEQRAWFIKWAIFLTVSLVGASAAGIASLLRNGQPVALSLIIRAAFISCIVGGVFLAALWDTLAATRPAWLIAVVLCAGAGGGNILDSLARLAQKIADKYLR